MTLVVLSGDLLIASRILSQAEAAGRTAVRVEDPGELPPPAEVDVLFVDWASRAEDWGPRLRQWCAAAPQGDGPRVVVFGPHSDLEAHAAAREAGLGPMLARSKLIADLSALMQSAPTDRITRP